MSLISARSLFVSPRRMVVDFGLFIFAKVAPRLFSILLIVLRPGYCRRLGISRKALLLKVLRHQCRSDERRGAFNEVWLVTVQPHMRERTMIKTFGKKITRAFGLSGEGQAMFAAIGITLEHVPRDWTYIWLMILSQYKPGRLFILSGLSDFWFMPLKVHTFGLNIAFDSYDPMGEYNNRWPMRILNYINYRYGKNYILRDARFKQALRRSRNWSSNICYLPDAIQMDIVGDVDLRKKFSTIDTLRFVSAGWVTAEGDGGILRSFQLIRALWPNAELHLCLTQFMKPEDPIFAPLITFMNQNEGCFIHYNLQNEAYQAMLDSAHVGVNLHDPNVFGEEYKEFAASMIRRSPSARILDFAARGCILMTTKEHRYSQHVFKLHSPHKAVIHLTSKTKPQDLTCLVETIRARLA